MKAIMFIRLLGTAFADLWERLLDFQAMGLSIPFDSYVKIAPALSAM